MNNLRSLKKEKELAQLISRVENNQISTGKIVNNHNILNKKGLVIGITGSPGVGKSTVINLLIQEFSKSGKKIGILAIDPSSQKTKGAFLGDRIRMQSHSNTQGVFIRSMATRGHFGGLSSKTAEIVEILRGEKFEIIIVETVGVGQTETEITDIADIVVTITTSSQSDEIQIMKAGILELSDIIVLNKCDNNFSSNIYKNLQLLSDNISKDEWRVPIIKMTASEGKGIKELLNFLERKMVYAKKNKK